MIRKIDWNKVYATAGIIGSVAYGVSLVGIKVFEQPVTTGSGVCQVTAYHSGVKQQYAGKGQFAGPVFSVAETRECGTVKLPGIPEALIVGETYQMTWTDNPNEHSSDSGRVITSFTQ